jgi:hypothetical protein
MRRLIGDIGAPNLIGAVHDQVAQQIRVLFMQGMRLTQPAFGINRLQPHPVH